VCVCVCMCVCVHVCVIGCVVLFTCISIIHCQLCASCLQDSCSLPHCSVFAYYLTTWCYTNLLSLLMLVIHRAALMTAAVRQLASVTTLLIREWTIIGSVSEPIWVIVSNRIGYFCIRENPILRSSLHVRQLLTGHITQDDQWAFVPRHSPHVRRLIVRDTGGG